MNISFCSSRIIYFVILLLFEVTTNPCVALTQVNCALKWIPESSRPNLPSTVISVGKNEYIARVFQANPINAWVGGRLLYPEKIGLIPALQLANSTIKSESYNILTNPNNCILKWVEFETARDLVPSSAVWINGKENSNIVIARGILGRRIISGHFDLRNGKIIMASENGYVENLSSCEILTSVYPPLELTIRNIAFSFNLIDGKNRSQCIAKEEYKQDVTRLNTYSTKLIVDHQKTVTEEFRFTEDNHKWKGIANLTMHVGLWYDSSDFLASFDLRGSGSELIYTRDKFLRSVKEYTIPLAPVDNNIPHLQFCTVASIVSGYPDSLIDFVGSARYEAKGMSEEHLKIILKALDRSYDDVEEDTEHPRNFVMGKIYGKLTGKYVLSLATFAANVKLNEKICSAYCVTDTIRKLNEEL